MLRPLKVELRKLFSQRGTYAGFVVLAGLIALIVYGTWRRAPGADALRHAAGSEMIVAGNATTAPFVLQFILPAAMEILMPLLIAAVAGGLVAGEVRSGTIRTMLIRPISRLQLLSAKLAAAWVYTVVLCAWVVAFSAALAYAVFGPGDMISIFADGLVIFSHGEAVGRLALAYGLATVGRCVLASIAIMFSCLFDNGLTAAAMSVASLVVFGALQQIPYFDQWQVYFLTWHLDIYRLPLNADINWIAAAPRAAGLVAYAAVSFAVAALALTRRDIS